MSSTKSTVISPQEAQVILDLAEFALLYSRVERATFHPDGQRHETDSDHTIMLSLLACAFAAKHAPHLDLGLISQFALIHDLVEGYAGDTSTLKIDQAGRQAKELREHQALLQLTSQFGPTYPWIHQTIETYERLDTPEARYVKMLDKIMPTLTHILNGGTVLQQQGVGLRDNNESFDKNTLQYLASFGVDQPQVMALRDALRPFALQRCYNNPTQLEIEYEI